MKPPVLLLLLPRAAIAACGVLGLVAPTQVVAAEWKFDPRVSLAYDHDDNNRLTDNKDEEISVSGAIVEAQVAIRAATQRSSFELTPAIRSTFYPSDETEEANDQFLRLRARTETQRSGVGLDARYSRTVTLGSYFPDSAIGEDDVLGDPDRGEGVGVSGDRNREEKLQFEPSVSFQLAPRHELELTVGYLDVGYEIQDPGDREDFATTYGSSAYRFQLSPTATLAISGRAALYDPSAGDTTKAYGVDVEWFNKISETSQVFVRGGAQRSENDALGGSGWSNGFAGGAGILWSFEVTRIFVDLNQFLDPNSSGRIVERTQLRAELSRQLSPLTVAYVSARAISDSGVSEDPSFRARDYATASIGFTWRFSRAFSLDGAYQYRLQDYSNSPRDARSNSVRIGITYEPNRR